MTQAQLLGWHRAMTAYMLGFGLSKRFAEQSAWIMMLGIYWNLDPRVISGYRSSKKQSEMQARWDAGDREGMSSRPVDKSKHSRTEDGRPAAQAVDITSKNNAVLGKMVGYFGLEWGGNYRNPSPNHFESVF